MAKKKPVIELASRELYFEIDDRRAKIISFNPNSMTLLINYYDGEKKVDEDSSFPFAHLPKPMKKLVRPL